jgi:hypothetical protein
MLPPAFSRIDQMTSVDWPGSAPETVALKIDEVPAGTEAEPGVTETRMFPGAAALT